MKVYRVEYVDYIDVANEVSKHTSVEDMDMQMYKFFADSMKQTKYIEAKTRKGAISNLKNLLYRYHLEIISAEAV